MDSSVSGKDEIWFLRVCHHVPHELYSRFRKFFRKETNFPVLSAHYSVITPTVRGRKQNIALSDAIPRFTGCRMLPGAVTTQNDECRRGAGSDDANFT